MQTEWYYTAGGAQQGPVSEEELKTLIANNELEANAMVWRKGMADWQAPSQLAELTGASSSAPSAQDGGGIAVQAPASQVGSYPVPTPGLKQGLAIASLICSIVGLLVFCLWCASIPLGVAGIIMGHIAASKAKNSSQEFGGLGMAKAGYIVGYIAVVASVGYLVAIFAFSGLTTSTDFQKIIEEAQREAAEQAEEPATAE